MVFDTIEVTRALEVVRTVSEELSMSGVYVHSASKGMYDLFKGNEVDEDKSFFGAVTYLTDQMKRKQNLIFVLTYATNLDANNDGSRQLLCAAELATQTGNMIVIISNVTIWNRLQRVGMHLRLDYPDKYEMYTIIDNMLSDYRGIIPIEWNDKDLRIAAHRLTGLSQIEAENVIACIMAKGRVEKNDLDGLLFDKDKIFLGCVSKFETIA